MSTPIQRQYWSLKNQNPEAVLFFQLGEFYELFFEDAHIASRVLGIQLTARQKGTENEMPMAGFPMKATEDYLQILLEAGYKVAVADQIKHDDGTITRDISRVVTPGVSFESSILTPETNNYLLALVETKKSPAFAIAYTDASTGDFKTTTFEDTTACITEIHKINPKEILIPTELYQDKTFTQLLPKTHITPRATITEKKATTILLHHFGVPNVSILGLDGIIPSIQASGLILQYLQSTQKQTLSHINTISHYSTNAIMQIDAQTFRHLEIFNPIATGQKGGTLLSVFEKPKTAAGNRLIRYYLANPLLDEDVIQNRIDAVTHIKDTPQTRKNIHDILSITTDIERILGRLAANRANARDLAHLRDSLLPLPELAHICQSTNIPLLTSQAQKMHGFESLTKLLSKTIVELPPVEITQGGMIQTNYDPKLDEIRSIATNATDWRDQYIAQQIQNTGISNLKIKYSKNFGFCLEVTKSHASKVPESWTRRQTLVNAERYTTQELANFETKYLSAESEANEREYKIFLELRTQVLQHISPLRECAKAIATIDVLWSFAQTAHENRWAAPTISNTTHHLEITNGRHPVVESTSPDPFIANSLSMKEKDQIMHLITGPNMAGKSTFLRQNALIILLAQCGSFVPATNVTLSLFDQIFTRVGASDNLAGGQSTFFVEMTETARILRGATEKSFIILDEIGRGTSTFDGISLAWSITQYLHNTTKAFTLFATHYHELIELADDLAYGANYHVSVNQNQNGIVFLRNIKKGGMSDSFGIEVAKLAGLPPQIIQEANIILKKLETEIALSGKPNLFSSIPTSTPNTKQEPSKITQTIQSINPDTLTPKEALDLLYTLKSISNT